MSLKNTSSCHSSFGTVKLPENCISNAMSRVRVSKAISGRSFFPGTQKTNTINDFMVYGEVEWTPIFDIGAFLWDRLYAFFCKWSFSINSAREALRSGQEKASLII